MLTQTLKQLFTRDLMRLRAEVEAYTHEANLWKTGGRITNPAGNLCLHLVGKLNTYIGRELGRTGYVRNRPLEFSLRDVPRQELLVQIDGTLQVVAQTLDQLDETALAAEYPILVLDEMTSTEYLLVHLATHLTYHLGQVNYHRRLLDKE